MEYDNGGCVACPIGKFKRADGESQCVACAKQTYQSGTGKTSCDLCLSPMYQWETGQAVCNQCPANEAVYEQSGNLFAQVDENPMPCQKCPAGTKPCPCSTESDQKTRESCFQRECGLIGQIYKPCVVTAEGEYQMGDGIARQHTQPDIGNTFICRQGNQTHDHVLCPCTSCDGTSNYYSKNCTRNENAQCSQCRKMTPLKTFVVEKCSLYADAKLSTCNQSLGHLSPSGLCNPCLPGTQKIEGKLLCEKCPNGKYGLGGNASCASCELGWDAVSGSSVCSVTQSECGGSDKYSPTGRKEGCIEVPEMTEGGTAVRNVFSRQVSRWKDGVSVMSQGIELGGVFLVATHYAEVGSVLYTLEKRVYDDVGNEIGGSTAGGFIYNSFEDFREGVGEQIRFGKILGLSTFENQYILCSEQHMSLQRRGRLRLLTYHAGRKEVNSEHLPVQLMQTDEMVTDADSSYFSMPSGLLSQDASPSLYVWIADADLKVIFRMEKSSVRRFIGGQKAENVRVRVWIGAFQSGLSSTDNVPVPSTSKLFGPTKLVEVGSSGNILILDKYALWLYPKSAQEREDKLVYYVCGLVDASVRASTSGAQSSGVSCDNFRLDGVTANFLDIAIANDERTVYVMTGTYHQTLVYSFVSPSLHVPEYGDDQANAARSLSVQVVSVRSTGESSLFSSSSSPFSMGYMWTGFVQGNRRKGGIMVMQSLQNPQSSYGLGVSVQEMSGDPYLCEAGLFYSVEKKTCVQVPVGHFAESWSSSPVPCPAGTVSNPMRLVGVGGPNESSWCRPCERLDYFTEEAGALNCRPRCQAGQLFDRAVQQCTGSCDNSSGYYFDSRIQSCVLCPLGMRAIVAVVSDSDAQGVQSFCEKCDIDYYGSSDGVCTACPAGKTAPNLGSTKCMSKATALTSQCGGLDGLYEYCSVTPTRVGKKSMNNSITSIVTTSRGTLFRTDGYRIEKSIVGNTPMDVEWLTVALFPWRGSGGEVENNSKYILKYSVSEDSSSGSLFHLIEVSEDEGNLFYASYMSTCIYKAKIASLDLKRGMEDEDYFNVIYALEDRIPWAGDCSDAGRNVNEMNGVSGVGTLGIVKDMALMQVNGKTDVLFVSTDSTSKFGCMSIRSISLYDGSIKTFLSSNQLSQPTILLSYCNLEAPYRLSVSRGSGKLYYSMGLRVYSVDVYEGTGTRDQPLPLFAIPLSDAVQEPLSMCVNSQDMLVYKAPGRSTDIFTYYPNVKFADEASKLNHSGFLYPERAYAKMMACIGQRLWFASSSGQEEKKNDVMELSVPLKPDKDIHCVGGYVPLDRDDGAKKTSCVQVGIGQFTDFEGAKSSVKACPAGMFGSMAGSASSMNCYKCPPGSIAPHAGSGGGCNACPLSEPYDMNGVSCSGVCPAGYYRDEENNCNACPPGHTSAENSVGLSSCVQCPTGSYSSSKTSFVCTPCQDGFVSPAGAFDCTRQCGDNQCSLDGKTCSNLVYSYEVITSVVLDTLVGSVIAAPSGGGLFCTDGNILGYFYDDCPSHVSRDSNCRKTLTDLLPKISEERYLQAFAMSKNAKDRHFFSDGTLSTKHEIRYLFANTYFGTCSIYRIPIVYSVTGIVDAEETRRHLAFHAQGSNSLQKWLFAGRESCTRRPLKRWESLRDATFPWGGDMQLSGDEQILYVSDMLGQMLLAIDMKRNNAVTILGELNKKSWRPGTVPTAWGHPFSESNPYAYANTPNGMGAGASGNIYLAMRSLNAVGVMSGISAFVTDGYYLSEDLNSMRGTLSIYCTMSSQDLEKFKENKTVVLEGASCAPGSAVSCFLRGAFDMTVYDSKIFVSVEHGIVAIDKSSKSCTNVGGKIWDVNPATSFGNADGDSSTSEFNMPFRVSMAEDRGILYIADRKNLAIRRIYVSGKCKCPEGFIYLENHKSCYNPTPPDGSRELKTCPFGEFALDYETVCRPCDEAFALGINNAMCNIWKSRQTQAMMEVGFPFSKVQSNPFPLVDRRSDWFGGSSKPIHVTWSDFFSVESTIRYSLGVARGHAPYGVDYVSLTFRPGASCDNAGTSGSGCWVVETRQNLKPKMLLPGVWYPCNDNPDILVVNEASDLDARNGYTCSCPWNLAEFDAPDSKLCGKKATWNCLRLAAIEREGRRYDKISKFHRGASAGDKVMSWSRFAIMGTDQNARETECSDKGDRQGPCFPLFQYIEERTASNLVDKGLAGRNDNDLSFEANSMAWSKETNKIAKLKCGTGWPSHYSCPNGYAWVVPNTTAVEDQAGKYIFVPPGSKRAPVITCLSCLPGSFSDVPLSEKVLRGGPYACDKCPSGKYAGGVGSTACENCPNDHYATLAEGGSSNCSKCPLNHYTASAGAYSIEHCSPCKPGTGSCKACVPGQFQDQAAQERCEPCRPGTFSNTTNQTYCYECELNTFQPSSGQRGCILCPQPSFAMSKGSTACMNCAPETLLDCDLVVNRNCGKGCGLNFYWDVEEKTCKRCPAGSMNANSTCAKSPTICEWANDGSRYISYTTSDPQSGEGDQIDVCEPGTGSSASGYVTCAPCDKGQYSDGGASSGCALCPRGTFSNTTKSSFCYECSAGTFSSERGLTFCSSCVEGTFMWSSRASACLDCNPGTYAPTRGLASCMPCSNGTFGILSKQIHDCTHMCDSTIGMYSGQGATACTKCSDGVISQQDVSKCVGCGKGMYAKIAGVNGYEGVQECAMCPAGKYNNWTDNGTDVDLTCRSCASSTLDYVDVRSNGTACTTARLGFVANDAKTGEKPCGVGQFRNENETECKPCRAGTRQPSTGQTSCIPCDPGFSQEQTGQAQCQSCNFNQNGRIASRHGSVVCEPCPAGHRAVSNMRCSICPKNTYLSSFKECSSCPNNKVSKPGSSSIGNCSFCGKGLTLSLEDGGTCKQCEPGKYTVTVDAISNTESYVRYDCVSCPTGKHNPYYGSPSDMDCKICDSQGYVPTSNQSGCVPCEPGQTALPEASVCTLCPKGFYSPSGVTCIPCPPGFYSDKNGSSQCTPCPPGHSANVSGQSACVACRVGTYANDTGTVECKTCTSDLGFADAAGTVRCKPRLTRCNRGQYIISNVEDPTRDHTCGDCLPCVSGAEICVSSSGDSLSKVISEEEDQANNCEIPNFLETFCPGDRVAPLFKCVKNEPKAGMRMRISYNNLGAGGSSSGSGSSGGVQIFYESCTNIENTKNEQTKILMGYVRGPNAETCYVGCKYGLLNDGLANYIDYYGHYSPDESPRNNIFKTRVLDVFPPTLCKKCPSSECPLGRYRPMYDPVGRCGPPCSLNTQNCSLNAEGCIGICSNAPSNSSFIDGSHELDVSVCPWRCHEGFFRSNDQQTCLSCRTDIVCPEGFAKVPVSECKPDLTSVELCKPCQSMNGGGRPHSYDMKLKSCLYNCTLGTHYASADATQCLSCTQTNKTCPIGEYLDVQSCKERGVEPACKPCFQHNDTKGKLAFTSHGSTSAYECEGNCIVGYDRVYRSDDQPVPLSANVFAKDFKCVLCVPGNGKTCKGKCHVGSYRNLAVGDGLDGSCVPCRRSSTCGTGMYAEECSTGNETVNPPCRDCNPSLLLDPVSKVNTMEFVPYDYKYISDAFEPQRCPRMCRTNHIQYRGKCITCDSYVTDIQKCREETKSAMYYETGQPKPCDFKYSHWNATDDVVWWNDVRYTPSHLKSYLSIADSPYVVDRAQKLFRRAGTICWPCPTGTGTLDERGDKNLCEVLPGYGKISEYEVQTSVLPIPSSATDIYLSNREPRRRVASSSTKSQQQRRRMLSVTLNVSSMQTAISAVAAKTTSVTRSQTSPSIAMRPATSSAMKSVGPIVSSCPIGFYNNGTSSFCMRCPDGASTTNVLKMQLQDCLCFWGYRRNIPWPPAQGTSLQEKSKYPCVPCGVNRYRPINDTSEIQCFACGPNETTFDTINATKCACKPGYYRRNGATSRCELCPGGFVCVSSYENEITWPPEGAHRLECMPNAISPNGSTSVENCTCRPGFTQRWRVKMPWSNGSVALERLLQANTFCAPNPMNSYFDSNAKVVTCKRGWRATYEKGVLLKQDGSRVGDVIKSCYLCNPGEFADKDPSVLHNGNYPLLNCTPCPTGSYSESPITIGQCMRCPNNTNTKAAGSIRYEDCGCAYPQVLARDNKSCVGCLRTEYRVNNQTCRSCPPNTEAKVGAESVRDCMCLPGFFAVNASDMNKGCAVCPKGTYSSFSSNNGCVKCPLMMSTLSVGSKSVNDCSVCERKDHCLVMSGNRQMCVFYIYVPGGATLVNGVCIRKR